MGQAYILNKQVKHVSDDFLKSCKKEKMMMGWEKGSNFQ